MRKHTPGPWVKNGLNWYGSNGEKVVMSDGPAFGSARQWPAAKANAMLVYEATEMLAMLEEMAEWAESIVGDVADDYESEQVSSMHLRAVTIIKRAKGEL